MSKRANGEGTVCKRSDGRFQAKILVGYFENGSPQFKTFTSKSQKEVISKMQAYKNEQSMGRTSPNEKLTLNDWLDIWITTYQAKNIKRSSLASYISIIEKHLKPAFMKVKLRNLKPHNLQSFYNSLEETISPKTIRNIHVTIHSALKRAFNDDLIISNPADKVTLPKIVKKEIECFTLDATKEYIKACKGERLECAYVMLPLMGLRRGELLGLKWADCSKDFSTVHIQRALYYKPEIINGKRMKCSSYFDNLKTEKSNRTIGIPKPIRILLKEHKKNQSMEILTAGQFYDKQDLIFCNELGAPIEPDNFGKRYKTILKNNNIPHMKLHGLRHTCASILNELGLSAKDIQETLGHSNIATTLDTYTHLYDSRKTEVSNLIGDAFKGI